MGNIKECRLLLQFIFSYSTSSLLIMQHLFQVTLVLSLVESNGCSGITFFFSITHEFNLMEFHPSFYSKYTYRFHRKPPFVFFSTHTYSFFQILLLILNSLPNSYHPSFCRTMYALISALQEEEINGNFNKYFKTNFV